MSENPGAKPIAGDEFDVSKPRYVEPAFLERLRLLDRSLEPRWNPARCRWEIWRLGKYVMTVQTIAGEYMPLDNRTMQKLFVSDTHKYKNEFEYIRTLHMEDEKLSKMKTKEQDEFVRACHRDMLPFLKGRRTVQATKVWEGNK